MGKFKTRSVKIQLALLILERLDELNENPSSKIKSPIITCLPAALTIRCTSLWQCAPMPRILSTRKPFTTSCGRDLESPAISSSHCHAQSLSSSGRSSAYTLAISSYTSPSRSDDCTHLRGVHLYQAPQAVRILRYSKRGPFLAEGGNVLFEAHKVRLTFLARNEGLH